MGALRIGTRGSALARWQAHRVQQLLSACNVESELVIISTAGDRGSGRREPTDAAKALFTKEIEDALLSGRVDLAVHSLKDLAVELPHGLVLAAVPEREDPHDALVARGRVGLGDLPINARVGTSSIRRAAALRTARSDLVAVPLRGNVPTRVQRVERGELDGAILALAGLKRLGLADHAHALSLEHFTPAAGQGALAVEARSDATSVLETVGRIDAPPLRAAVEAERAALARLGGGCRAPVGAVCESSAEGLTLRVTVYVPDAAPLTAIVAVSPEDPVAAGVDAAEELARKGVVNVPFPHDADA